VKLSVSALAIIASLGLATAAIAQNPPAGGPDAKGNAPLKHMHTVDDGAAKRGANSFTHKEAQQHIMHSGFTDVSALTKGKDGVWRGTAMKDGVSTNVGLDFKGNVSVGGPVSPPMASAPPPPAAMTTATTKTTSTDASGPGVMPPPVHHMMRHRRHHHHWRHHHVMAKCAHPGPNGVACSGKDRNGNGISDKEDRAIKAGDKP
jgi:hypothetical protein